MTDELDTNQALAQHIAAEVAKAGGQAEVRINPTVLPIPAHVAANILEFLRRAKCDGMEALAWVEAYQIMQQHAPQQPQQGK